MSENFDFGFASNEDLQSQIERQKSRESDYLQSSQAREVLLEHDFKQRQIQLREMQPRQLAHFVKPDHPGSRQAFSSQYQPDNSQFEQVADNKTRSPASNANEIASSQIYLAENAGSGGEEGRQPGVDVRGSRASRPGSKVKVPPLNLINRNNFFIHNKRAGGSVGKKKAKQHGRQEQPSGGFYGVAKQMDENTSQNQLEGIEGWAANTQDSFTFDNAQVINNANARYRGKLQGNEQGANRGGRVALGRKGKAVGSHQVPTSAGATNGRPLPTQNSWAAHAPNGARGGNARSKSQTRSRANLQFQSQAQSQIALGMAARQPPGNLNLSHDFATQAHPAAAHQKNNYILPQINKHLDGDKNEHAQTQPSRNMNQWTNSMNNEMPGQKLDDFDLDQAIANFDNYYPQINDGLGKSNKNLDLQSPQAQISQQDKSGEQSGQGLAQAAQHLFQINQNSTQNIKSIKKLIVEQDMFQNFDNPHQGIADILSQNIKMNGRTFNANGQNLASSKKILPSAGSQSPFINKQDSKEHRQKIQERVYSQNLGKLAEFKRTVHNKTHQAEMRDLPPSKNFIQKNKNVNGCTASIKLDRLRKLKHQTNKMINENQQLNDSKDGEEVNEAEEYLLESIDRILSQNEGKPAKELSMPGATAQKSKLEGIHLQLDKDDSTSDKTLEQFKNLRSITNQRRLNGKASGVDLAGIKSGAQRLNRSKSQGRGVVAQTREGGHHQRIASAAASGLDISRSPSRAPALMKKEKRVRSQTAGGAGSRARSAAMASRNIQRKQQSAVGQNRLGNLQRSGHFNVNASTSHLTQKRKSAAGFAQGNFVGDRVASSVTTHKPEFGHQKSVQAHNAGGLPLNLDDDARITDIQSQIQNADDESLPGFIAQRESPMQSLKKPKNLAKNKEDPLLSSQDTKSINLNVNVGQSKSKETTIAGPEGRSDHIPTHSKNQQEINANNLTQISFRAKNSAPRNDYAAESQPNQVKRALQMPKGDAQIGYDQQTKSTKPSNARNNRQSNRGAPSLNQSQDYSRLQDRKTQSKMAHTSSRLSTTNNLNHTQQLPPRGNDRSGSNERNAGGSVLLSSQRSNGSRKSSLAQPQGHYFKSKFHPAGQESQIQEGQRSQSPLQPIVDGEGQVVYEAKHRRPKWVPQTEYERFMRFEDRSLSKENTRNSRIRMEDPFSRSPEINTVFSHIKDTEVAKYIIGVSYLEKAHMDRRSKIGIRPELQTLQLFATEMALDYGQTKIGFTAESVREGIALMEFEFKIFGVKDPYTDLKRDEDAWVANFRTNPTHVKFREAWEERRGGRAVTRLIFREMLGDGTKEWKMNFDPRATEKMSQIYGSPLPASFLARHREMEAWRRIMERRGVFDLDHMQPDLGQPILDIIDGIMREYRRDYFAEKARRKERENHLDLSFVLDELKESKALQLPELEFEALSQPTRQEMIDRYNQVHSFAHGRDTRDSLQAKIEQEFERLTPIMEQVDLTTDSTFLLAADQSDYRQRMGFAHDLDEAHVWDTDKIVNDDVYRQKQENKMRSRVSEFDRSILERPDPPKNPPICHSALQSKLFEWYFTFEKQYQFYYQWYTDYQRDLSQRKRSEYVNFYKFKHVHETPESRQLEAKYKKERILNSRHWDFGELQSYIYRPEYRNIRDPKEKLLKNEKKFYHYFEWFMKQFDGRNLGLRSVDKAMKLGADVRDLEKMLFFLHIGFESDADLTKTDDDPLPRAPETRLNNLVFRARHAAPEDHGSSCYPPLEYFEVTFDLSKNFRDKEFLHDALENVLKKRGKAQYQVQKALLESRSRIKEKKLAKHEQKREQLKAQYRAAQKKKLRPRSNSVDKMTLPTWQKQQPDDVDIDILGAVISSNLPFTEDFLPSELLPENKIFAGLLKERWAAPFEEPIAPFTGHLEHEYLGKLVQQYEQDHQDLDEEAQDRPAPARGAPVTKIDDFQKLGKLHAREDVASYDPGVEKTKYQDDCLFLKWLERPLNRAAERIKILEVVQDGKIQMGGKRKERLFEDMTVHNRLRLDSDMTTFQRHQKTKQKELDIEKRRRAKEAREVRQTSERVEPDGQEPDDYSPQPADLVIPQASGRVSPSGEPTDRSAQEEIRRVERLMSTDSGAPSYLPMYVRQEHVQIVCSRSPDKTKNEVAQRLRAAAASPPPTAATLNTAEKVLGYVDKQVRKELLQAVTLADLPLLRNYVDQFNKSLTQQINYVPEAGGDTVLHHAVLMDYDQRRSAIDPGEEGQYEFRTIKKALSKESAESLKIKTEIVQLLVAGAGADPDVRNQHKITARNIAKNCLRENKEVLKAMGGNSSCFSRRASTGK